MNKVENGFRIFLLVIGSVEVLTNLYHLTRGSLEGVAQSAKRQHQEIPGTLPLKHYRGKARQMFFFGCFAFLAGFLSNRAWPLANYFIGASLVFLSLMGIIQAIRYRQSPKTWVAGMVYSLPLIIYLLLK